jgi:hypothetical protein
VEAVSSRGTGMIRDMRMGRGKLEVRRRRVALSGPIVG